MTVSNIRFISGENVIADLVEETDDNITIRDAIVAMPVSEDGVQIGFAPWAPLQDPEIDDLTIAKQHVMYITRPTPQLEEQFNKMFNRIQVQSKKIITP
jgi:hypothetical protein|tara:strand:+ start:5767 stop:6063 length:297 start_codon:yes stop_codon:yes gene_type:complete